MMLRVGKIKTKYNYVNCQIWLRKVGGFWLHVSEGENGQVVLASQQVIPYELCKTRGKKTYMNSDLKMVNQDEAEEVSVS